MKRLLAGIAAAASVLAIALSLAGAEARVGEGKPMVVATTGMIADAAHAIGGGLVHVKALMRPGIDPHAYRQTRSDIASLARADLVLWNGLYLEAQMEDFLHKLAKRRRVRAVAEEVPRDLLLGHETYRNRHDPHLWMDPVLWKQVVANIADAMASAFPELEEEFSSNADAYLADIDRLAGYASRVLLTVPGHQRVLLSAHDAFNYFGKAYGFEVLGIQGISTESEPGLYRIRELVDLIVEREIAVVFVESSVSERNVRALVEGAAARGRNVKVGGELYSDAMGPEGTYEGTYIGMIDHNVTLIAQTLGGQAPLDGMLGKLSGAAGELSWLQQ